MAPGRRNERDTRCAEVAGTGEVFLDHQATTPLDPRVLEAMLPFYGSRFGNPHSVGNARAEAARGAVETARASVAALIGAQSEDIIFTSGATEACNIALRGGFPPRAGRRGGVGRLIYSAIEHGCVRETARALRADGLDTVEVQVNEDGIVNVEAIEAVLEDGCAMVSVMVANNEIGTIQPVSEIGALCRLHGSLFHTDAAQAAGKLPLDVGRIGVDMLSISGHKLYGPQGIGALYCAPAARKRLRAVVHGGGQEGGLRPGTLPLALCVGLGEACRIATREMEADAARIGLLRDALLGRLRADLPGLEVNGCLDRRLPGNLNVSVPGVDGDALVASLGDVAISTGSACSSGALGPSHVLVALGVDARRAESAIRIGLGKFTTASEVEVAATRIVSAARMMAA